MSRRPFLEDLKPLSLLHPGLMAASKRSASLQGTLMVQGTQEACLSLAAETRSPRWLHTGEMQAAKSLGQETLMF